MLGEVLIWIFTSVVLPAVAPLAGMALIRQTQLSNDNEDDRKKEVERRRYITQYKDGQLGYIAIAYCFSALAELFAAISKHGWPSVMGPALLLTMMFVTMASILFAAQGAAYPARMLPETTTPGRKEWIKNYGTLFCTILLTLVAALMAIGIHLWANEAE